MPVVDDIESASESGCDTDESEDTHQERVSRREGLYAVAKSKGITPKQQLLYVFKGLEEHYRSGANGGGSGAQDRGRENHYTQVGEH